MPVPVVRKVYEMLEQSQWWSAERLIGWQRSLLAPLLQHARRTVPFYQSRLDSLYNGDAIDWGRWSDVPILTRAELSASYDALLSRTPVPHHAPFGDVGSSGSTGHPVTIRTTRWLNDLSVASNWRGQRWAGLDWSRKLLSRGNTMEGREIGTSLGPWGPSWLPEAATGQHLYSTYSNPYADDLEIIQREAVYAYGATSNQLEIFFDNSALPRLDSLRAVLTRGGAVTDYLRAQIRRVSDAKVVEVYSSKEGGTLAHLCPSGHCFHTHAETVLVEIVDAAGRPVAAGEKGRVVITPFGSTAMPLIRYDQGDEAIAGGPCACGRSLPGIRRIEGRTNAVFVHPDGRRSREMMPLEGRKLLGAGRWQVRQVGATAFEVDYVRHDWGNPPDLSAFQDMFRTVFFADAVVTVKPVEDFQLGKTGKYLEYVNLWRPDVK